MKGKEKKRNEIGNGSEKQWVIEERNKKRNENCKLPIHQPHLKYRVPQTAKPLHNHVLPLITQLHCLQLLRHLCTLFFSRLCSNLPLFPCFCNHQYSRTVYSSRSSPVYVLCFCFMESDILSCYLYTDFMLNISLSLKTITLLDPIYAVSNLSPSYNIIQYHPPLQQTPPAAANMIFSRVNTSTTTHGPYEKFPEVEL